MDKLNKLQPDIKEKCDKLAISIVDRISEPINKQQNEIIQWIGTISFIMGIGIKDIIKEELLKNPKLFLGGEDLSKDIIDDIILLAEYLGEDLSTDIIDDTDTTQLAKNLEQ